MAPVMEVGFRHCYLARTCSPLPNQRRPRRALSHVTGPSPFLSFEIPPRISSSGPNSSVGHTYHS